MFSAPLARRYFSISRVALHTDCELPAAQVNYAAGRLLVDIPYLSNPLNSFLDGFLALSFFMIISGLHSPVSYFLVLTDTLVLPPQLYSRSIQPATHCIRFRDMPPTGACPLRPLMAARCFPLKDPGVVKQLRSSLFPVS